MVLVNLCRMSCEVEGSGRQHLDATKKWNVRTGLIHLPYALLHCFHSVSKVAIRLARAHLHSYLKIHSFFNRSTHHKNGRSIAQTTIVRRVKVGPLALVTAEHSLLTAISFRGLIDFSDLII